MGVRYFLRLCHSISEPWCLLNLDGNVLAFNPAMAEFTGCSHQKAEGLPFKDFLADKQNSLPAYLKIAASSTDATPGALAILNAEKQIIECQSNASLIPLTDGNKPCLLLRLSKSDSQDNVFALLNAELETLRRKNHELIIQKAQLDEYIKERTQRLHQEIKERKAAQKTLLQAEKMAALGSLVSGVAHEVNTPLGIGVTGASHLEDITRHFKQLFIDNAMKKSDLSHFLDECEEAAHIIHSNLQRASELIHSFKQVAVDQSNEDRRIFNVKAYINDVFLSLYPVLKNTSHSVTFECPENLQIDSYPGAFSQILTNLVINSLNHGFEGIHAGNIIIKIESNEDQLQLIYKDNGIGMPEEHREKVFDPFFTTKRGRGGSGLGMHVVYNLVCDKLFGTIQCNSSPGQGVTYEISIPLA